MGTIFQPPAYDTFSFQDYLRAVDAPYATDPYVGEVVTYYGGPYIDDGAIRYKVATPGTGIPQYSRIGAATLRLNYQTQATPAEDTLRFTAAKGAIRRLSPYDADGPLTTAYADHAMTPADEFGDFSVDVTAVLQELVDELTIGQTLDDFTVLASALGNASLWWIWPYTLDLTDGLSIEYTTGIHGVSLITGTLTRGRALAGSIDGVSSLAGPLNCLRPLAGGLECVSTINGVFNRPALAGSIDGVSTVSGALTRPAGLAGPIAGVSSLSAPLSVVQAMQGRIDAWSWLGAQYPAINGPVRMQEGRVHQGAALANRVHQGGPLVQTVHQGGMAAGSCLPT